MGIGGAGMSGLALLLDQIGCKVSGCDAVKTSYVKHLEERNIPVIIGHEAKHIDEFMPNVLVYSSAIPNDHPEILKAWQQGIQVSRRAEVLSQIFNVRRGVGVAGTHGKTTTSSMISLIAEEAGADPTIAIGGDVLQIGTNAKLGQSDYMVAELDESDRSFVYFHPEISVITNIDWDHRDHYMTFKSVTDAFAEFLSNSKREGKIIMCMEDGGIRRLREEYDVKGTIETYGWGRTWNWGAAEVSHHEGGGVGYRLFHDGKDLGLVELSVSGEHNVLNSLAAYAASHEMGIEHDAILKGLKSFRGAKRRLQKMGEVNGIMIYDDYGHHPNEISATLSTVQSFYTAHIRLGRASDGGRLVAAHLRRRLRRHALALRALRQLRRPHHISLQGRALRGYHPHDRRGLCRHARTENRRKARGDVGLIWRPARFLKISR